MEDCGGLWRIVEDRERGKGREGGKGGRSRGGRGFLEENSSSKGKNQRNAKSQATLKLWKFLKWVCVCTRKRRSASNAFFFVCVLCMQGHFPMESHFPGFVTINMNFALCNVFFLFGSFICQFTGSASRVYIFPSEWLWEVLTGTNRYS